MIEKGIIIEPVIITFPLVTFWDVKEDIINSLRNNILFGLDKKKYSDKMMIDILKKANLKDFYKQLPNGLSEKISEEGLNISGGEVQRIGIARALVNNPEIIFLDEIKRVTEKWLNEKEINSFESGRVCFTVELGTKYQPHSFPILLILFHFNRFFMFVTQINRLWA